MSAAGCSFCARPDAVLVVSPNFWAKYDPYPVSPGHVLVIPQIHIESLFSLSWRLVPEMFEVMKGVERLVGHERNPDAWNIGINDGRAAGRTIDHLHVHMIPRYAGDVADPRGGVRKIIPGPDLWIQSQEKLNALDDVTKDETVEPAADDPMSWDEFDATVERIRKEAQRWALCPGCRHRQALDRYGRITVHKREELAGQFAVCPGTGEMTL